MKTKQILLIAVSIAALTFSACKKDEPVPPSGGGGGTTYNNGVFITNEGSFGTGTGTVDFYNRSNGSVSSDIFQAKNGFPLGNIVQSMEIYDNKGYIVVNNAGKVEVVDGSSFATQGTISGLTYPRYFLGINSAKGYVSEWGAGGVAGAVKVVDLNTKTVTGTITTGKGAEGMVQVGNFVYVACSGGFDKDSVVTVIDATTNAFVTNINVGYNPKSIKVDANGKIWVLCAGQWDITYTFLEHVGKLVKIDPSSNTVELTLPFASIYSQPGNLVTNSAKTMLYYFYSGGVYSQDMNASVLSGSSLINRFFYGFGMDPANNYFYCSDAVDFVSNGKVIRYNSSAVVVDSFNVGVIPGNFYFK